MVWLLRLKGDHVKQACLLLSILFTVPAFALPPAQADPVSELAVPCSTASGSGVSSTGFMRKCNEVLSGDPAHGQAPKGMIPLLDEQVKKVMEDPANSLYAGHYVEEDGTLVQTGKPVCNLTPNEFNHHQAEVETNHLGQSCGNPSNLIVHTHKGGFDLTIERGGPYGNLEYSWMWGLKAQIYACQWKKVRSQMLTDKKLEISPYCEAAASKLKELMGKNSDTAKTIEQKMASEQNIGEIWRCDPKTFGTGGNSLDTNHPMQAAQWLCGARTGVEGAFLGLAQCEVKNRAEREFRQIVSNPDTFLSNLQNRLTEQVRSECSHSCDSCKSYGCCNRKATACARTHYRIAVQNYFQSLNNPFGSCGQ